jgi:TonB-dependent SusC/RagA subfamily outer membrane receptor
MKIILAAAFLLFTTSIVCAQTVGKPLSTNATPHKDTTILRICAPSRGQLMRVPLYVIYAQNQLIYQSDTLHNNVIGKLSPNYIQSISVLKDADAISKYGGMAKNGVIEIYIKDENRTDVRKMLQADTATVKH